MSAPRPRLDPVLLSGLSSARTGIAEEMGTLRHGGTPDPVPASRAREAGT